MKEKFNSNQLIDCVLSYGKNCRHFHQIIHILNKFSPLFSQPIIQNYSLINY
jgi:hypothetical protein